MRRENYTTWLPRQNILFLLFTMSLVQMLLTHLYHTQCVVWFELQLWIIPSLADYHISNYTVGIVNMSFIK